MAAAAAATVSTIPSAGGGATVTQAGAFRAGQVEVIGVSPQRLPHRGATGAVGAAAAAAAYPQHPGSGGAGGGGAAHAQGDPQGGGQAGGGGGCPGARLLNARWEFEAEAATKLLSDANSDYRVVGVLGTQGAGKSSLLNSLLLPEGLPAGAGAGAGDVSFPVQGPGHVAAGWHCTPALELRVHSGGGGERLLLLDTPPLWSGSVLEQMAAVPDLPLSHASGGATTAMGRAIADARALGLPALSVEAVGSLLWVQLGALLLAACHTVVLMVDAVDEPRLWEYLQVIDMVAHMLPDVATAAVAGGAVAAAAAAAAAAPHVQPPFSSTPGTAVSTAAQRRVAELVVVVLPGDCSDEEYGSGDEEEYGNNRAGSGSTEWLSYSYVSGPYDGMCARVLRPQRDLLRTALYGTRLLTRRAHVDLLAAWGSGSGAKDHDQDNTHGLNTHHHHQQQQQQQAHPDHRHLNFWALPRLPGLTSPAQLLQLHRPLRSALLSMPRRPLAPQPLAPSSHASAQGQTPTSLSLTTAPHIQQQQQSTTQQTMPTGAAGRVLTHTGGQQLGHAHAHAHVHAPTEGEWLRGVGRLWAVELQRCTALQSYVLALQRTACVGGGGWPLGGR